MLVLHRVRLKNKQKLTRAVLKRLTLRKCVFRVCACVLFYICVWINRFDLRKSVHNIM